MQEEKKNKDYESLIDEIAALCGIDSPAEQNRIRCWKANRRYRISLKYRRWREVFRALGQVRRYGKVQAGNAVKELLWALFRDAWVWKKLYPAYRRFFHDK